jgi:hypothetical protein
VCRALELRYDLAMRWLVLVLLIAATARAGEITKVEVEVGQTVEANVSYARGWMCDDPSLISADLVTRDDHNVWIVKGVKIGHTQCRVGLEQSRVSYVFDLAVKAKRQRR